MSIQYVKGDLFAANERAIAHGCNCHGFTPRRHQMRTILTIVVFILIKGWSLMIALGMIAGYTGVHGLAIGLWPAYALAVLLSLALGMHKGGGN